MSADLIGSLNAEDRETVLAVLEQRSYPADAIIIGQGDTGDDIFFVMSGLAHATLFSADGRVVSYRDIEAGAVFGELAAIDGKPRSASVVAAEPVRLGRMSARDFRRLIDEMPAFAWAVIEHLTRQSRAMTERIFEYSTMLVRERLVHELLRMARSGAVEAGEIRISPAPTHFALAARLSTHREAISREMSRLAKQGIHSKQGDTLVIHRLDLLEAEVVQRDEI